MGEGPSDEGQLGQVTWKIVVSLIGAGACALCAFVLLEALLPGHSRGAVLLRFQVGTSLSMALFAGLAIVIYVRLSR